MARTTGSSGLEYELRVGARALDDSEADWLTLEARTTPHLFQRYLHSRLWFDHVGSRSGALPVIVTAYAQGQPVLLLPLSVVFLGPLRLLTWLGGPRLVDYGDILFDQTACEIAAQTVCEEAFGVARRATRLAAPYLPTVRSDAIVFPYLESAFRVCRRMTAPYVPAQDWETYRDARSRKDRHEWRRLWKRLGAAGDTRVVVYGAGDDGLDRAFDRLVELHKARHPGVGGSEFNAPGHAEMRRAMLDQMDGANLRTIELDGEVIAVDFEIDSTERSYGIMTAYDAAYFKLAPGRLVSEASVCAALSSGRIYDFCLGDEYYKRLWTRTSEPLATFVSTGPTGLVLAAIIERRERARAAKRQEA